MRAVSHPPKRTNPHRLPPMRASPIPPNIQTYTITHHNNPQQQQQQQQQQRSYADLTKNHEHQFEDAATKLKNFLEEFKGLFTQLLHQNSMILNMLTTLINKTH